MRRRTRPIARLAAALRRLGMDIAAQASAQVARWVLWTPVAFGAGAASYFAMTIEPAAAVSAGLAALAVALMAGVAWRGPRRAAAAAMMLGAVCLLGFADAALSTALARAPVVPDGLGVVQVRGRVVDIASASLERVRLLIVPTEIEGLTQAALPKRVRLTLRAATELAPGDAVAVKAILNPPPGPPARAVTTSPVTPGSPRWAASAWR